MATRSNPRFLILFAVALAVLWSIDLLLNLRLLERLPFSAVPLGGRFRDFAAVALVLVPTTVVVTAAAVALASAIAWLSRRAHGQVAEEPQVEAWAALTSALTAVEFAGAGRIWGLFGSLSGAPARLSALAVGALTLILARAALRRRGGAQGPLWAMWAPLLAASAAISLECATRTAMPGLVPGASGLFAATILALPVSGRGARMLAALPCCAAIGVAFAAVATSHAYGRISWSATAPSAAAGQGRPPIVLIVLDTVRADHLRLGGYHRDTMPALEAWARSAAVFRRAVSPAGWTAPAHASMFTGLPVSLHGVHYALDEQTTSTRPYPGLDWLPRRLAALGYRTLAVSANPLAVPPEAGFEHLLDRARIPWERFSLASLVDRWPPALRRLSERLRWRLPYLDAAAISVTVRRAVPAGDQPLFLFINFLDAHSPYNPPGRALRLLGVRPGDAVSRTLSHHELNRRWATLPAAKQSDLIDLYDGGLRGIDLELGPLLAWIDDRWAGQAAVIVTSDHGEELGEAGRVGHEWGLPQRLLHVPLLLRVPGIPAGARDELVTTRALYRLILALASGDRPGIEALTADDDWGVVAERYPALRLRPVFGEDAARPWVALLAGKRKVVGPSAWATEAYDLTAGFDDRPTVDAVAADADLAARIDMYWEAHQDRRTEAAPPPTDEELDRLRALGYVQ